MKLKILSQAFGSKIRETLKAFRKPVRCRACNRPIKDKKQAAKGIGRGCEMKEETQRRLRNLASSKEFFSDTSVEPMPEEEIKKG